MKQRCACVGGGHSIDISSISDFVSFLMLLFGPGPERFPSASAGCDCANESKLFGVRPRVSAFSASNARSHTPGEDGFAGSESTPSCDLVSSSPNRVRIAQETIPLRSLESLQSCGIVVLHDGVLNASSSACCCCCTHHRRCCHLCYCRRGGGSRSSRGCFSPVSNGRGFHPSCWKFKMSL